MDGPGRAKVEIEGVTKIFGDNPDTALALIDQGMGKDEIQARTQQVVAVVDVNSWRIRTGAAQPGTTQPSHIRPSCTASEALLRSAAERGADVL